MVENKVTREVEAVPDARTANPQFGSTAVTAMIAVATSGELAEKSQATLAKTDSALPPPKTALTITIDQMKEVLRAADCLYDNDEIWRQLGATEVPAIPDAIIQEAHKRGGRVIFRCSSINKKTDVLRKAGHSVVFRGLSEHLDYTENVPKDEWIVIPSHIDRKTLSQTRNLAVTSDNPAPTPEDWFSAIAYAKLDGQREPRGCENLWAFTSETGVLVGLHFGFIRVYRDDNYGQFGYFGVGAARFARD